MLHSQEEAEWRVSVLGSQDGIQLALQINAKHHGIYTVHYSRHTNILLYPHIRFTYCIFPLSKNTSEPEFLLLLTLCP